MLRSNVVIVIPLNSLWDANGIPLEATREACVSEEEIRRYLREDSLTLLVADVGKDLEWLSGQSAINFWKDEARIRLVAPEKAEDGFHLEEYANGYCYVASLWRIEGKPNLILFERYH